MSNITNDDVLLCIGTLFGAKGLVTPTKIDFGGIWDDVGSPTANIAAAPHSSNSSSGSGSSNSSVNLSGSNAGMRALLDHEKSPTQRS